ncbi:uncharacterized protein BKA55DRAFT_26132 [Fusarium redolens]|uniref:Uncharacterized protein n=1 Tax=Fusarium redolens TaxID=48865 RepID=A0A9P9KWS3_FUSRE|nr:uncharacterized protein BKA55DRAFT_26132 [Fusarium redolens]KAH7269876.1 hypothetical protein BKA55DRAFT_26132 [Fusarium redolens]
MLMMSSILINEQLDVTPQVSYHRSTTVTEFGIDARQSASETSRIRGHIIKRKGPHAAPFRIFVLALPRQSLIVFSALGSFVKRPCQDGKPNQPKCHAMPPKNHASTEVPGYNSAFQYAHQCQTYHPVVQRIRKPRCRKSSTIEIPFLKAPSITFRVQCKALHSGFKSSQLISPSTLRGLLLGRQLRRIGVSELLLRHESYMYFSIDTNCFHASFSAYLGEERRRLAEEEGILGHKA